VSAVPGPDQLLDSVTLHGTIEVADDVRAALEVLLAAYRDRPVETVHRPDASLLLASRLPSCASMANRSIPDAYARATPDPLAAESDGVVEHLLTAHPEQVVRLAHLLDPAVIQGAHAVAPIRVDRFGVTFRVDGPADSGRARLNFPAQVTECPFSGDQRTG
jgi:hypothetical protein